MCLVIRRYSDKCSSVHLTNCHSFHRLKISEKFPRDVDVNIPDVMCTLIVVLRLCLYLLSLIDHMKESPILGLLGTSRPVPISLGGYPFWLRLVVILISILYYGLAAAVIEMKNVLKHFKFRQKSTQYLAMIGLNIGLFSSGLHLGWPSTSLPLLTSGNYSIHISTREGSFLTSITPISVIFGCILTAMMMKWVGKKTIMLLAAIPLAMSWLFIGFASSKLYLYVGRALAGFIDGALFVVGPSYLSEIADPEVRGLFGTSIMLSLVLGITSYNIFILFMSMESIAYFAAAVTLIMLVIIPLLPESPYLYLLKGNVVEAENSLRKFRGKQDVQSELVRISEAISKNGDDKGKVTDLLLKAHFRKCLFISIMLSTAQHSSGTNAIQAYCETAFQNSKNISPKMANSVFYVVLFIATMVAPLLVDFFGRKPLLLVSAGCTTLSLFATGTVMYFKRSLHIDESFESIQLVLFLLFVIAHSSGLQTIPMLVTSEIYPSNLVGTALCLVNINYSIVSSATIFLFEWTYYSMGIYVPFFVYGACCLCGMVLIALFLIETKGKTLEDIQTEIRLQEMNNNGIQ